MLVLFDIGGTKMRIGRSRDGHSLDASVKIDTPRDFKEGISAFKRIVDEFSREGEIEHAAGGIAGVLDHDHEMLLASPNMGGWIEKPLRRELSQILKSPVTIENDTAVVGLGEAHHGAGKGHSIVAYITVSTGVGGVRIVDGRIDRARFGFEPGHQIIDLDGTACLMCNERSLHADGKGHLEGYISGSSVEHRFERPAYELPQDDPLWDGLAHALAVGLNNTIVHWSPDVVVLGGSMIVGDPRIPLALVERYLERELVVFPEIPELKPALLKDQGGLYGALVLARTRKR
jgi:predicted NBD/HSP70 family sugar kinase